MAEHWERRLAAIGEVVSLRGVAGAPDGGEGRITVSLAEAGDRARLAIGRAACLFAVLARIGEGDTVVIEVDVPDGGASGAIPVVLPVDLDLTLADAIAAVADGWERGRAAGPPTEAQRAALDEATAGRAVAVGDARATGRHVLCVDAGGAPAELRHAEDRIDARAAAAIASALAAATAALATPEVAIGALALVSPSARAELEVLGAGPPALGGSGSFAERVAEHARRAPDRPAVTCDATTLTYGELARRSTALARRLRDEHGAGPDALVAIALGKGVDAVTAIVGTAFAGAAWLALDPAAPPARRRAILRAARPAVTVVAPGDPRALVDGDASTLSIGDGDGADGDAPLAPHAGANGDAPLAAHAGADDLAYVVATSGSTGEPKLVAVEHASLRNYLAWKLEHYALRPSSVCLQLAPLSFDSAVSDVVTTLGCGGHLVLVPEDERLDPRRVGELCREHGVTVLAAVPSHYRTFVASLPAPGTLETVTLAGEALDAGVVAEHLERLPAVRIVNEYGPAEGTIAATAADVRAPVEGRVAIGRPIAGVEVVLVDRAARLAGPGLAGEIALAGACLARGYHGDGARTDQAFVTSPDRPGRRIYRTGDIGRWREDGELEFLGRLDRQVKIRGNRVELEEVEAALRAHPQVADAAAVVTPELPGGDLVAYVVRASDDGAADRDALREHLATRLPAYMLPAQIVAVDRLPLTANGKLDRRLLDLRRPPASHPPSPSEGPADELEAKLLELWRELLEQPDVGVESGFFEAGGHSLLAVQLAMAIEDELGVEPPLGELFDNSSVRAFAGWLREHAELPG